MEKQKKKKKHEFELVVAENQLADYFETEIPNSVTSDINMKFQVDEIQKIKNRQ